MAASRRRCVQCWKLFWPNYRNRTKVKDQQRVCSDCGRTVGHRVADRRYRLGRVAPQRVSKRSRSLAPVADRPVPPVEPVRDGAVDAAFAPNVASQVHLYLAAIAALVDPRSRRVVSTRAEPLPIGLGEESGRARA